MTIISGVTNGIGKTSLMTFFLNESAFNVERIHNGQRALRNLGEQLGFDIEIPKHFTYLNGEANFFKLYHDKRRNLRLYPERFGIQSEAPEGVKCQFIPEWSTLGIDEAQTWFPSRDGDIKSYQFSAFEKHRHNNLDIYMATTRPKLIDLRIRDISQGMFIYKRDIKHDKYNQMIIDWYFDFIPAGNIEGYLDAKPEEKKKFCSKEKATANYNVFDIYDPEGHKHLFYEGFNEEDFKLEYGV